MKKARASALSVLVISLLSCAGCARTAPGRSDGDVLDLGALAKDFWEVRETAAIESVASPRIAVVEFTVEYVSAAATGDTGELDFGASMKVELPGVLYEGFVGALPAYGRHAVPIETISEAEAYGRLKGSGIEDAPLETSAVKAGYRYPVDGLLSLIGEQSETDAVIRDLLDEIEADYAFQVRFRVGVRGGRASIEKGSTVRVVARDGAALLETKLALISPQSVTEEEPGSRVTAIDSRRFVRAIQQLFRPCIGLALVRTGRA